MEIERAVQELSLVTCPSCDGIGGAEMNAVESSVVDTVANKLWHFSSDLPARRAYFTEAVFSHPAKLHLGLLQRLIDLYTSPGDTLLDPMAGTGSLMIAAAQQRNVILRDIQPEYVAMMDCSASITRRRAGLLAGMIDIDCGDARNLRVPRFDHAIFSPPYGFETGNGLSNARRAAIMEGKYGKFSHRWRKYIEAPNHASFATGFRYAGGQSNTGNKSGRNYWADMKLIYQNIAEQLPSEGKLILVLKNHFRRRRLIDVTGQTIQVCEGMGLSLLAQHGRLIQPLSLWQRRRKEQGLPIVGIEDVLVFQREIYHAR